MKILILILAYLILRDIYRPVLKYLVKLIAIIRAFLKKGDKYIYRLFMPHRCYDGKRMGGWLNWFRWNHD
jgi:hypothetical protein